VSERSSRANVASSLLAALSILTALEPTRAGGAEQQEYGPRTEERTEECRKALAALPPEVFTSEADVTNLDLFRQYAAALLAYDRACLYPWKTLRPQTREVADTLVGFLFLEQGGTGELVCAAFRLSPKRVATAAHCLYVRGAPGALIDPHSLSFRLISKPDHPFPVRGLDESLQLPAESQLSDSKDIVVLLVDTSRVPLRSYPNLFRSHLPYHDYLLIPGLDTYSYWFRQGENISKWIEAVKVDKGGSCFRIPSAELAVAIPSFCVVTMCQTVAAMSGAPIFGYDHIKHQIFIGGIHLRSGGLSDS